MSHAQLSPSSSSRWVACPGSVKLIESLSLPPSSSVEADEGSAAHWLANECLTSGRHPVDFVGSEITIGKRKFLVDMDMAGHVNEYVLYVKSLVKDGDLLTEVEVPLDHLTGEEDAVGTADSIIIRGSVLTVVDLKYGAGVEVSSKGNTQLIMYLLGAVRLLEEMGYATKEIEEFFAIIHQPRRQRMPSVAHYTRVQLEEWFEAIKRAAETTASTNAPCIPGESQCRFCPAAKAVKCDAFSNAAFKAAGLSFEDLTAPTKPIEVDSDIVKLGKVGKLIPIMKLYAKNVESRIEELMIGGVKVPGFKFVLGKVGNRAWLDESLAESILKGHRVKEADMYTYKLISPTQAEKKFKKDKAKWWEELQPFIHRADAKPVIVPEEHEGEEVSMNEVKFTTIEEKE